MAQVRVDSQLRCPYCHDALVGVGRKAGCESCFAWHHAACLAELGRCANCGDSARPPRAPSLEFERARLNELLAKGCRAQGCRSIETVHVGLGYTCRRHLELNSGVLRVIALLLGVSALALPLLVISQRAHLDSEELLAYFFLFALLSLGSGILSWKRRALRAALGEFQKPASARTKPEASSPQPAQIGTAEVGTTGLKSPKLSA